jgi:hypothetical protein
LRIQEIGRKLLRDGAWKKIVLVETLMHFQSTCGRCVMGVMGVMGALMEQLAAREAALAAGLSVPPVQRMIDGKILPNDL